MPNDPRRLLRWQWRFNAAAAILSCIAIGLTFANQILLAQLLLLPITLIFLGSCWVAYQRYQRNRVRRSEILSQLDQERDRELIELFDNARAQRNLPPDEQSRDGYSAAVRQAKERAAAQANLPPGVKRRGDNQGGTR